MNSPANISLLAPDRTALEDAGGISAGWAPVSQVLIVSSDAKSADRCCMLAESLAMFATSPLTHSARCAGFRPIAALG